MVRNAAHLWAAVDRRTHTPGLDADSLLRGVQGEREFGDFELALEANPDWPADTGVVVRKHPFSLPGIQVVVDHRPSGSIGGFYGGGIGNFHAISFTFDASLDEAGRVNALRESEDDPSASYESLEDKAKLLTYGATLADFLAAWRPAEWNELRIRVVGAKPVITTWVNGTKIAERQRLPGRLAARAESDECGNHAGQSNGLPLPRSSPM